jgi:DNA repair exonuclease SbcCD ATPase subunit
LIGGGVMEQLVFDMEEQSIYAEMNVINSLLDCYFKEAMMAEYVSDNIIQEGVFGRAYDMTKEELQGKNIVVKILTFVFRYIKNLFKAIFTKSTKIEKSMDTVKSQVDEIDKQFEKNQEVTKRAIDRAIEATKEISERHKEFHDITDAYVKAYAFQVEVKDGRLVYVNLYNFEGIHQLLTDIETFHDGVMNLVNDIKTKDDLNRMASKIQSYCNDWMKYVNKYTNGQLQTPRDGRDTIKLDYVFRDDKNVERLTKSELEAKLNELKTHFKKSEHLMKDLTTNGNPLYDWLSHDENVPLKSSDVAPLRQITAKLNVCFIAYLNEIERSVNASTRAFDNVLKEVKRMQENALKISQEITKDIDFNDPKYAKIKEDIMNNPDKVAKMLKGNPDLAAQGLKIDAELSDVNQMLADL